MENSVGKKKNLLNVSETLNVSDKQKKNRRIRRQGTNAFNSNDNPFTTKMYMVLRLKVQRFIVLHKREYVQRFIVLHKREYPFYTKSSIGKKKKGVTVH